jgi:hypothetical protein
MSAKCEKGSGDPGKPCTTDGKCNLPKATCDPATGYCPASTGQGKYQDVCLSNDDCDTRDYPGLACVANTAGTGKVCGCDPATSVGKKCTDDSICTKFSGPAPGGSSWPSDFIPKPSDTYLKSNFTGNCSDQTTSSWFNARSQQSCVKGILGYKDKSGHQDCMPLKNYQGITQSGTAGFESEYVQSCYVDQ